MKILYNLKTGALSSLRSWKGIIINWLVLFILISLVSLPVRSGFKSMLGSSMVTELMQDSINADVITDLLRPFLNMFSALTTGFFLIIILSFFLNAFITGGLFTILRDSVIEKKASVFFSGAAANFWSFLVIIIINIMIFSLVAGIIIAVPFVLISGSLLLESYFGIPGVGLVTFNAITSGDQPILKAVVGLTGVLFVLALTVNDYLYTLVDPRLVKA